MNAQHTPGTWTVKTFQDRKTYVVTNPDSQPFVGQVIAGPTTCPNGEANARLIAAAPDLLAEAVAALRHTEELRDAWQSGALHELDGRGGTRSNRNVDVEVALRAAVDRATEPTQ